MEPRHITSGGADRLKAATALHGEIFKTDPVIRFLVCHLEGAKQTNYIPQFIGILLRVAAASDAIFHEAWTTDKPSDASLPPASSAVWICPGRKMGSLRDYLSMDFVRLAWNMGPSGLKRMIFDFQATSDRVKKKKLRHPDGSKVTAYYYLFFLSTAIEQRGKGLASELVQQFQAKASKENVPIWLESTTPESHQLYLKLGFKDVVSWKLGKGVVNENGKKQKNSEGVPIWAMIWWPESKTEVVSVT